MNFKLIDTAIEHYKAQATDGEKARFDFFRGLWEMLQEEADRIGQDYPYETEDAAVLESHYWDGVAALLTQPVVINAGEFGQVCKRIADYMADNAGLESQAAEVLRAYDWRHFADHCALDMAGKDPAGFVEDCLRRIDYFEVDPACPSNIFMMVPSFALRAFLQPAAERIMGSLTEVEKNQIYHDKPLRCPVCGAPATSSSVGGGLELESHARMLHCNACGTTWPFERIRCGCCGTRNQSKLHWFHVEGDPAHRIHTCDECKDYMRTTFQNDLGVALSPEVEDVAMAYLDSVAKTL